MTRIVTTHYRPKCARKRKAAALDVAVITSGKGRASNDNRANNLPLWKASAIANRDPPYSQLSRVNLGRRKSICTTSKLIMQSSG